MLAADYIQPTLCTNRAKVKVNVHSSSKKTKTLFTKITHVKMFCFYPCCYQLYQPSNFSASADLNKQNATPITHISNIISNN